MVGASSGVGNARERRRAGGTLRRHLGRQAEMPESPVDHGRLLDEHDQRQPATTARTGQPLWFVGRRGRSRPESGHRASDRSEESARIERVTTQRGRSFCALVTCRIAVPAEPNARSLRCYATDRGRAVSRTGAAHRAESCCAASTPCSDSACHPNRIAPG